LIPNAADILNKHWDSWVTLADLQTIKRAGLNTIRIPIGCKIFTDHLLPTIAAKKISDWAFRKYNDSYIQGAALYLDKAIVWARETGLKVYIDLHGAPESQNGFDNSGQRILNPDDPKWTTESTVSDTLFVLQLIADKYAQSSYQDVVVAIELLNEPLGSRLSGGDNAIVQYYENAYNNVRKISDTPVMVHDAFQNGTFWENILTSPDFTNVIIDTHQYQVFSTLELQRTPSEHRQFVSSNADTYASKTNHYVIVGEWSAAMTDCAVALNGDGIGAKYSGDQSNVPKIGSCDKINFIELWDQTLKDDTRMYIESQIRVYEQMTNGWVFWNFKTEASAEWDLFRLLNAGIFPKLPLDASNYKTTCSPR
jgi:glucan 1,3-beta-glucosidase